MGLLTGKIALVTGASKGIGRAIALTYAEHGANVAFTYLSSVEQGQALESELQAKGVKAKGYRSDASDFAQADKLINDVKRLQNELKLLYKVREQLGEALPQLEMNAKAIASSLNETSEAN